MPPVVFPVPRKEFVEPGLRRPGDAAEGIGEPGLRIDIVELGGADEGGRVRPATSPLRGVARRTALRTYIITASRMISGELLKYRKGFCIPER